MSNLDKYKVIFQSKVSYGRRYRYPPLVLAFIFILLFIFSLFLSTRYEEYYYPVLGKIGLVLILIEIVFLRIITLYRRVRIYKHNESFILQISEANKVLFAKEFIEIEYWWNYQNVHLGKVVTSDDSINKDSKWLKGIDFNIFSSTKPRGMGKSLPNTLFVKFKFHDEEVVLYESLGYFENIPANWPYKIDINSLNAESYKLGKCVQAIEGN